MSHLFTLILLLNFSFHFSTKTTVKSRPESNSQVMVQCRVKENKKYGPTQEILALIASVSSKRSSKPACAVQLASASIEKFWLDS